MRVPVCPGGSTVDLRGRRFSVRLFLEGRSVSGTGFGFLAWFGAETFLAKSDRVIPGGWVTVEGEFAANHSDSAAVSSVVLDLWQESPDIHAGNPWVGTVYYDDLQIQ